jgi:hypothetical protein
MTTGPDELLAALDWAPAYPCVHPDCTTPATWTGTRTHLEDKNPCGGGTFCDAHMIATHTYTAPCGTHGELCVYGWVEFRHAGKGRGAA